VTYISDLRKIGQKQILSLSNAVFIARRNVGAVYAVIMRLSVSLSQVGVLQRRINPGSHKKRHTIAQGL